MERKGAKLINKSIGRFEKIKNDLICGEEMEEKNKASNAARIILMQEENKLIANSIQKSVNFRTKLEELLK